MKNMTGNANWFKNPTQENKISEVTENVKNIIPKKEIEEFVKVYNDLLQRTEKLYAIKCSKEIKDIQTTIESIKKDINLLISYN